MRTQFNAPFSHWERGWGEGIPTAAGTWNIRSTITVRPMSKKHPDKTDITTSTQRNARRWIAFAPLLFAAAPFCIACLASGSPDEPSPLPQQREFPPIAFGQYAVNFGEVPPMPVIDAHFDFVNRSPKPVEILGLRPSCNCLNPTLMGGVTTYQPGEAGRFHIQVRTANEPSGPQDYLVEMDYKGADEKVYSEFLIFRVTLPELKVTIEPSEVLFYQLSAEAGTQTIHVTDFRDEPLQVTEVLCDSPYASFKVGEAVVDEHGRSTIPIEINIAEGIPPMREITYINIRTTDEEFSQLQVPMLIHGPVQSQEILPASATVPAPTGDAADETSDADDSEQP